MAMGGPPHFESCTGREGNGPEPKQTKTKADCFGGGGGGVAPEIRGVPMPQERELPEKRHESIAPAETFPWNSRESQTQQATRLSPFLPLSVATITYCCARINVHLRNGPFDLERRCPRRMCRALAKWRRFGRHQRGGRGATPTWQGRRSACQGDRSMIGNFPEGAPVRGCRSSK